MKKIYEPRISVFTDFLPEDDWKIIEKYCRDNKDNFPFVGYDSPVRWKIEAHSKNPDLEYVKSFLITDALTTGDSKGVDFINFVS